jgi:AraC-like DNA-binding protein
VSTRGQGPLRLLIADAATLARAAGTGLHRHGYWQLDHCAAGRFAARAGDTALTLAPGQGLLIPPGVMHQFTYPAGARYVSWKFTWDGDGPGAAVALDAQPGWSGLAAALAAAPPAAAVPHLLAAALALAGPPPAAQGLAAAVTALVESRPGHAWSVAAVARHLGLSPGHASARFRAAAGTALKRWLDQRRAEHLGRLLAGSDLGIADLAVRCGFADQFALSRFFHRVTGERPSRLRSAAQRAGTMPAKAPGGISTGPAGSRRR